MNGKRWKEWIVQDEYNEYVYSVSAVEYLDEYLCAHFWYSLLQNGWMMNLMIG